MAKESRRDHFNMSGNSSNSSGSLASSRVVDVLMSLSKIWVAAGVEVKVG